MEDFNETQGVWGSNKSEGEGKISNGGPQALLFSFIKWMSHHSSSFLSHRAGGQLGHYLLPWTNQSLKTIYYLLRTVLKFSLYAILAVKVQILTMPHLRYYNSHPFSLITPSIPSFLCCKSNCSKTELRPCTFLWRGGITGKNLGWVM